MREPKPCAGFVLVNDRGHMWASSFRIRRKDVVAYIDSSDFGWSYAKAKKGGWRVIKATVHPALHESGGKSE